MSRIMVTLLSLMSLVSFSSFTTAAQESTPSAKGLLLTKSSGFQHSVIERKDGQLGHAEKILIDLAKQAGVDLEATKDAAKINANDLKNYKLVMFYTSGDLTKDSKDGGSNMPETGVADLDNWIKQGGGFMGFHSATDSFRTDGEEASPYIQLIGAEFRGHGNQFVGTVKVVDPKHPAVASIPKEGWSLQEEWYLFNKYNKETMHVLALLEMGEERSKQEMYNIPDSPIIWCSRHGKGRVYNNGMGHREDVWTNEIFQKSTVDAIKWTLGEGKAKAKPNYDAVVPTGIPQAATAEK